MRDARAAPDRRVGAGGLLAAVSLTGDPYGAALPAYAVVFACVACGNRLGVLAAAGAHLLVARPAIELGRRLIRRRTRAPVLKGAAHSGFRPR